MEIEKRLVKLGRVSFSIYSIIGAILAMLSGLAVSAFGLAKLIQLLWLSF
jgi:hypothetical protein